MAIQRMDHVGVIVEDLAAATDFFLALGLERQGGATVEGQAVDQVLGIDGARSEIVMLQTPDGHSRLELAQFHAPPSPGGDGPPAPNAPGIRHVTFLVDDLDAVLARLRAELVGEVARFEGYRVCYARGPEGIIVELAERIGEGSPA